MTTTLKTGMTTFDNLFAALNALDDNPSACTITELYRLAEAHHDAHEAAVAALVAQVERLEGERAA